MKIYRVLTFCLLAIIASLSSAEEGSKYNLLIEKFEEIDRIKGVSATRGRFNDELKGVKKGDGIELSLNGKKLHFNIRSVRKGKGKLSFSGFGAGAADFITMAENNGKVVGSIQVQGKLYKVRPGLDNEIVITEVSTSNFIDHDRNYYESFDGSLNSEVSPPLSAESALDSGSEITVLVAYTSAFEADAGDVSAYMDLLEEETNTSYANSQINTSVKIVHAYKTSYEDSGSFSDDLSFFSNSSNAETAELLQLRELYNADIMMILTGNDYGGCGQATVISAVESNALAAAKEACAAGYFSFGHEIGHLMGARHIVSTDPSTEPFPYGHGYCNTTPGTWRTVMAYGCSSDSGGDRIQYWSNPDVSINGDVTGSVDLEDNARVLNERSLTVANFRVSAEQENYAWLVPVISLILQ
ncbi:M12 family metallo-peptidase [Microbulbifer sp. SSSA002]|uniref:M12 family metallo-peptidase n=1 Tax=Microbulbifer sp. SSSA002 TaxID=3243376 RepID=UPI0040396928